MNRQILIPAVAGDGTLYPVEKLDAHVRGLLHLAVSVFVFDADYLLVQRRAAGKYHCGGLWANTCCSHPHWDESVEACAHRRLEEELGFSVPLQRHATVEYQADVGAGLSEHERVTLFSAEVDRTRQAVVPNPDEVDAVRWIRLEDLHVEVRQTPERFTPWFRIYLERFPALRFS
ncbi:isopentenyl-diphosphate Delta-isomerase [Microvirga tunisiensis]|uniref:Isopentenyl-diphosphate Delta-isomerase n=2 Tax=Pannonibacter tanglangensis TaxID=2750084 RepID=A0A7X5EZB2_9HYPH|nr:MULTISPECIES: isopentenyl-diphosphate Delta-isomerase [unclassified Pannonibacter]NBN63120.1 isopentenyl-diphosphate Delta-isomerase [Pannonibacter sp. XCT-34]NBN76684.1 isopentenyl-diphosphate Delta-isomerase [Pannonibacter sp. XCT-53]